MNYANSTNTDISQITISNYCEQENQQELVQQIYKGLQSNAKQISSRYFYNKKGSELFEQITHLPEYYPTRTEISILTEVASTIVNSSQINHIIELGSGDCKKISILLNAVPKHKIPQLQYIPVDVSESAILKSADLLSLKFPGLQIHGIHADFMKHLQALPGEKGKRLICFFGSTLGNLTAEQAQKFLLNLRAIMHPGDKLLIGLDRTKDLTTLQNAYNDTQNITAQFNKNILNSINQIAQTNFNPQHFQHLAFYNQTKARIEMHLIATQNMHITSPLFAKPIHIREGEKIHTENSHKYTLSHIKNQAQLMNLNLQNIYSDTNNWFSLIQLSCT